MKLRHLHLLLVAGLIVPALTQAQTMIEGIYVSPAGDNGRGACTVEVKSMGKSPKYGDELYSLQSAGEGACEWTAVGVAKNYAISGGMVTSGGDSVFVALKWPFGPGGKQMNLAAFNTDGSTRHSQSYTKQ